MTTDDPHAAAAPWLQGKVDHYQPVRPLGEGGFAITHVARRHSDGQEVVVKQLRMERVESWKAVELFEREAAVMRHLDHPCIPRHLDDFVLGSPEAPQGYVLVQSLVQGRTLEEIRRGGGGLTPEQHVRWFLRLLEVCEFLHRRQPPLVHRDISPKNVIVQPDGEPVLIDFGMVQARAATASAISSTSAGTFGYAPMEQFVGRAVPSSDLYGLAMTFIAAVTGHEPEALPFESNRCDVRKALHGVSIDARLLIALEAMTEPDAARRNVTAAGLLERLAVLRGATASGAPAARDAGGELSGPTTQLSMDEIAAFELAHFGQRVTKADAVAPAAAASGDAAGGAAVAHWRAVRERTLRLGERAWPAPPPWECHSLRSMAVSGDGTRAVVSSEGSLLIDLRTMAARPLFKSDDDWGDASQLVAISADGQCVVSLDCEGRGMHVFQVAADGSVQRRDLERDELDFEPGEGLALSPDHGTLAVPHGYDEGVVLLDVQSGHVVQRLHANAHHGLVFSPDGRYLLALAITADETRVFAIGGGEGTLKATLVAFAPDGRTMALYSDAYTGTGTQAVEVGVVESLLPLRWSPKPVSLGRIRSDGSGQVVVQRLCLSPDGARLAVALMEVRIDAQSGDGETAPAVRVYEVASGAQLASLEGVGHVEGLGFCSDSDRLLIDGHVRLGLDSGDGSRGIAVYSVEQGRLLGAIHEVRLDDEVAKRTAPRGWPAEAYTLFARSPLGLYGRLTVAVPRDGRAPESAFERPDLIASLLCGVAADSLASGDEERDALDDLAERIDFIDALQREHRLEGRQDPRPLLEASRGLTHLLPWMLERALSAGSGARFGAQTGPVRASLGALCRAAGELRGRSPEERDVLFEDSLAAVAREAQARAEAAAKQHAAAAGKRGAAPGARPGSGKTMVLVAVAIATLVIVALILLLVR